MRTASLLAALRDPAAAIPYVLGRRQSARRTGLSRLLRLLSLERTTWEETVNDLLSKRTLHNHLRTALDGKNCGQISEAQEEILYGLCRVLRPNVVVETGVSAGVSSAIILQALIDNSSGTLWSIDMPNYEEVYFPRIGIPNATSLIPAGLSPGWAVPSDLQQRWILKTGLSSEELPKILTEVGGLDIFFHDSEHTYENMLWEFKLAWRHLRDGGLIIAHDISWNKAFFEFCKKVRGQVALLSQSYFLDMGIVRKV